MVTQFLLRSLDTDERTLETQDVKMSADSSCFSGRLLWTRQWPYVSIQGVEFLDWASVSQDLKDYAPRSQMDGVYRAWSEDVTAGMRTVK